MCSLKIDFKAGIKFEYILKTKLCNKFCDVMLAKKQNNIGNICGKYRISVVHECVKTFLKKL